MATPKLPKRSAGFTLIELVVVITILGILAAIALPKFVALQRDARVAKLQAARGAVNAAAALGQSAFLTRGTVADGAACPGGGGTATNAVNGTICTQSGLVQLANGYPSGAVALGAATPGIVGAAGLVSSPFSPTLAQLNAEGFAATVAGNVTTISVIGGGGTAAVAGGQANATCSFTYTSAGAGAAPNVSAITAASSAGC